MVTALAVLLVLSGVMFNSPFAAVAVAVDVTEVAPRLGTTVTVQDCEAPGDKAPAVQVAAPALSEHPAGAAETEPPAALTVRVEPAAWSNRPVFEIEPVTGNDAPPEAGAEMLAATSDADTRGAAGAGAAPIPIEPATTAAHAAKTRRSLRLEPCTAITPLNWLPIACQADIAVTR